MWAFCNIDDAVIFYLLIHCRLVRKVWEVFFSPSGSSRLECSLGAKRVRMIWVAAPLYSLIELESVLVNVPLFVGSCADFSGVHKLVPYYLDILLLIIYICLGYTWPCRSFICT